MSLVFKQKIHEFCNKRKKLLKFEGFTSKNDTIHTNIEINGPKLV